MIFDYSLKGACIHPVFYPGTAKDPNCAAAHIQSSPCSSSSSCKKEGSASGVPCFVEKITHVWGQRFKTVLGTLLRIMTEFARRLFCCLWPGFPFTLRSSLSLRFLFFLRFRFLCLLSFCFQTSFLLFLFLPFTYTRSGRRCFQGGKELRLQQFFNARTAALAASTVSSIPCRKSCNELATTTCNFS